MHLMYTLNAEGKREYTLKKVNNGEVTKSAHPARFSPDDKYSRYGSGQLNRFRQGLTHLQAACDSQEALRPSLDPAERYAHEFSRDRTSKTDDRQTRSKLSGSPRMMRPGALIEV